MTKKKETRRYNRKSSAMEKEIAEAYSKGESSIRVAKRFGTNPSTVLTITRRLGFKTRTTKETSKKYSFNENFFEKIDNQKKAYWLGFIASDGCLYRNKDLIIGLNIIDKEHVEKFVKDIDGNNKISIKTFRTTFGKTTEAKIQIRSSKMVSDLKRAGIMERKSFTQTTPVLNKSLQRHFWRGEIDGNGSIGIQKSNNKYCYLSVCLSGSLGIVKGFKRFVKNELNFSPVVHPDHSIWRIRITGKRAIALCSLFYKSADIFLERKFKKFCEYVQK